MDALKERVQYPQIGTKLQLHGLKPTEEDKKHWIGCAHLGEFKSSTARLFYQHRSIGEVRAAEAAFIAKTNRGKGDRHEEGDGEKNRPPNARTFLCPCGVCKLETGCPCGCPTLQEHIKMQADFFRAVLSKATSGSILVKAAMKLAQVKAAGTGDARDFTFKAAVLTELGNKSFISSHFAKHGVGGCPNGAFFIPQPTTATYKLSHVFWEVEATP
eukprot:TRINITY_DN7617_c1_g2_i1.p1 TRINITY_DN7617_c1_g2~~TRINITY_DN7617_c1_g2_i1.p1  ORF type:complete len:215 (-),score=27.74 TRINITY_DN7617_c1_g2_i1:73-717(-)